MSKSCMKCGKRSELLYCDKCVKKVRSAMVKKVRARIAYRVSQGSDMKTLKDIERDVMEERLAYFNGNRTWAADSLGMSVRSFRYKVKEYELYLLWPQNNRAGHED